MPTALHATPLPFLQPPFSAAPAFFPVAVKTICQACVSNSQLLQPAFPIFPAIRVRESMPGLLFDNWKINLLKMRQMRRQRMPTQGEDAVEATGLWKYKLIMKGVCM